MNQKDICRIIGLSRISRCEKYRRVLKYIHRQRGSDIESFAATDGRCLSVLRRPIPNGDKNDCLLYESALLDANGRMAKNQDLVFPHFQKVYPDPGEEADFVVSVPRLRARLEHAKKNADFLVLDTGGIFYAVAHNEVTYLNPYYVRIMAQQMQYLQGYGFGDRITMSVWPKKDNNNPPVLFRAKCNDMSYDFLVMPAQLPHYADYLGANVKIN